MMETAELCNHKARVSRVVNVHQSDQSLRDYSQAPIRSHKSFLQNSTFTLHQCGPPCPHPDWAAAFLIGKHTSIIKAQEHNCFFPPLITTSKQESDLKEKASRVLLIAFQLAIGHITGSTHTQQQTCLL